MILRYSELRSLDKNYVKNLRDVLEGASQLQRFAAIGIVDDENHPKSNAQKPTTKTKPKE